MHKKPNTKLIGIFTFSGIFLFIIITLLFLSNKILVKNDQLIVMSFKESIQGLKIGSPVVFRGVEIGKVAKIDLISMQNGLDFDILVYIKINNNQSIKNTEKSLEYLINSGLRARLTIYSFITGQLMIELEILPNTEINLIKNNIIKNNKILEIPTVLSAKGTISKGINNLPFKNIIENTDKILIEINNKLPQILENIDNITNNINNLVKNNSNNYDNITIENTINNFNKTIKSIENFVDYLERHPDSLLKGKGDY